MSEIIDDEDVFYSAQSLHESMQETIASPYFTSPKGKEAIRFTSPILSPKPSVAKDSILEELLPSHVPQAEPNFSQTKTPAIGDRIFGVAFKIFFSLWLLASLLLFLNAPKGAHLTGLWQVSNWFIVVLAASIFSALAFARLLASQADTVVYSMAASIPIGSALLGLYLLGSGLIGLAMAVGLFIVAAVSGLIFWSQKQELEISVGIIKTGAQFLLDRPQTFKLTGQIAFAYAFFVLLWLGSFSRLLVTSLFLVKILFVVVLLWTSALAGAVNKLLIGERVKAWLLDEEGEEQDNWRLIQKHFDALCVAAAILAATRFVRLTAKALNFTGSRIGIGALSGLFNRVSEAIERTLARFTDYVIYYLVLREDSDFWSACGGVGRALAGRPSLSFTVDSLSQLLLFFATLSVSIFSTSVVYYLSAHGLNIKTASLLGIVCYLALDLIAAIFTASIDASFLAFLTIPQCREKASLQAAFSAKLLDI